MPTVTASSPAADATGASASAPRSTPLPSAYSLVAMYTHCRRPMGAPRVFDEVLLRHAMSWNSLRRRLRLHLLGKCNALALLKQMLLAGASDTLSSPCSRCCSRTGPDTKHPRVQRRIRGWDRGTLALSKVPPPHGSPVRRC